MLIVINNRLGIKYLSGAKDEYHNRSFFMMDKEENGNEPKLFDKEIIVKDAESECFGLLAPDGSEMIPTIYEHLLGSEDNGLFYFGCGGFEDEDHPTFFSGEINGALWGVVTCNGKRVIDAKYLNFKIQ